MESVRYSEYSNTASISISPNSSIAFFNVMSDSTLKSTGISILFATEIFSKAKVDYLYKNEIKIRLENY